MSPNTRTPRARARGTILLAVLIVVVLGTLSGASILLRTSAQVSASGVVRSHDQLRALAWSGLQGVMSELADQREDMLDGERPRLTETWELFRDPSGAVGIVRLVDLTPEDRESVIQSEGGKLNINLASEEMLAAIEPLGPGLAEKIVAARAKGPFSAVEELLAIEGISADLLFGELTELVEDYGRVREPPPAARGFSLDRESDSEPSFELSADVFEPTPDLRLIDLLTVHTFDPNIQAGIQSPDSRGDLRINLNLPWSDRLGRALSRRWNDGAARAVEQLMTAGITFSNDAAVCAQLDRYAPNAYAIWEDALDVLTTTDDQFRPGRVDLNHAPFEVLRALPGFSREAAQAVVEFRGGMTAAQRRSVTWPLTEGILDNAEFMESVDWLSTRSMQWRVRIEVGIAWPDERSGEVGDLATAPLRERMVIEAIVDVASQRPRIAYLRDITALDAMRELADEGPALFESLGEEAAEPEELELAFGDDASDPDADPLEPSGRAADDSRSSRINRISSRADRERPERARISSVRSSRASQSPGGSGDESSTTGDRPEAVDRRTGRWTTRSGGNG